MRELVLSIAETARQQRPGFLIVPQNGEGLLTIDGEPHGAWVPDYAAAIDGLGREDFLFGYEADDRLTPASIREAWGTLLDRAEDDGIEVLVTDYCSSPSHVTASYETNRARGFIAFASPDREMKSIPALPPRPFAENARSIERIADAANFLYLINPSQYPSRSAFVDALCATGYDLLILDLFVEDGTALMFEELERLKQKPGGARRLVLAYLSIGEAEAYRDYWEASWDDDPPEWLLEENVDWEENYAIEYWNPAWHEILLQGEDAYLERVLRAGFDGVYLDRIDAYERFEGG